MPRDLLQEPACRRGAWNLGFERREVNYFILDSTSMQSFRRHGEPFGPQEPDKAADFGVAHHTPAVANEFREMTVVLRFLAGHMAISCAGGKIA